MPLGHFSVSIVNSCQQAILLEEAQEAIAEKKSPQQCTEFSDDSTLTTLTNTPVLSDVELATPNTPSRGSELSDTPKYDGSSSTPRRPRTRRALQSASRDENATAVKLPVTTISSSRNVRISPKLSTNSSASVIQRLATGSSPYQLNEVLVQSAQGDADWDGGRDSKSFAHVSQGEQGSTSEAVNRPRRLAIAEQNGDECLFKPMNHGFENENTTKSDLDKLGQELGFLKPAPQQQLRDSPQKSRIGTPTAVPYYQPGRVFKWKVLERPGQKQTNEGSRAAGSQERKAWDGQICLPPRMLDVSEAQAAQQPATKQRRARTSRPPVRIHDAVFISVDSDDDIKMEEPAQSPIQPEPLLEPINSSQAPGSRSLG